MEDKILIPLNGLTSGRTVFEWSVGAEFFKSFENSEILDAQLNVKAETEKSGLKADIDVDIEGHITVACDRCLSDLVIPVHTSAALRVRYRENGINEAAEEDGREIVEMASDEKDLVLDQIVYDYSCLALPLQRVHADGGCDEEVTRHIGAGQHPAAQTGNSPFAALGDLLAN